MSALAVYHPRDSLVHRLPAGMKLLGLLGVTVITLLLREPWQVGGLLVGVLLAYAAARIPCRVAWAQVRPLLWLVVVLAAFQWVVNGWRTTVLLVGTMVCLILLAALVSLTTRASDLIDVVMRVSRPLRLVGVEPERVGLLMALGLRAVPVVVGLAHEVREAQVARGLTASPTAFAVPLVVRSLRHADRLGDALVARGADD
jgi:biotin transport system permease protein